MKKISEHLGQIIVALAGVALLVAAVVVFKAPIGEFYNSMLGKETSITDTVLEGIDNIDFGNLSGDRLPTATGNPLVIKDAAGGTVKELTATLENDSPFNSVTVNVTGKNLFDKSVYINGQLGQPNMYTMYPVSTYGETRMVYLPIEDGKTYSISQTVFGKYARYSLTDTIVDDKFSNNIPVFQPPLQTAVDEVPGYITLSSTKQSHTFVNKFNHKYLVLQIFDQTDTLTYDEIADSIQVELGSTATTPEEHKKKTYTLSWSEGVNKGELDVINGLLTKEDGTQVTVEKTAVNFYEGVNVVSISNATSITAKYNAYANPLEGKSIVAIGDSMVYGHTLASEDTWLSLIAERNNMSFVNYGKNGRNLTHNPRYINNQATPTYDGVVDEYDLMVDDADYVVVFAGTNDIERGYAYGSKDSRDTSEIYGALNELVDGLKEKYPNSKIVFITPYARAGYESATEQYVNAVFEVCESKGIYVFDNTVNGVVDWTDAEDIANYTLGDTYHLNEAGMELASYEYESFLKRIS